jgi:protein involved in polysaccharide export with SLBB domain
MKSPILRFKPCYFLIATVCFLLLAPQLASAQTVPPAIQNQINAELQKRGLTESEARVRLLQKGIDLDNVPPAELPKYQEKVTAVLDELQAEKKTRESAAPQITINTAQPFQLADTVTGMPTQKPAGAQISKNALLPITTPNEAAAEASQRVIQTAAKNDGPANIYGHSLFTDKSLEVFRTTDGAQAPETYVLGDGDEIRITIFGASQTDIQQKISVDGSIQPSGNAKIFLKGLTLAQAREVIKERLSSSYTFRSDQLAVTIVAARTILINVFGEAKITGGFTISALNSALNALSAAGGPTEIGSVRSIQLIRGETRKNIDIYTFMNDPATQFKFDLQNNDIIFVPVVKLLVSIEGAVKRPMSYEMLPNETLTDLIRYAGDVNMNVFPDFVQIQRYVNGEQRLMEYNLEDVRSGKTKVALLNGDIVRIKAIGKPMDRYVEVEGSVYYPGKYDLSANPTLGDLLTNARPTL